MKKQKKLLMITWRDIKSPFAGGAETLTHGILKKLKANYEITVLTSAYPHCKLEEIIDGIKYLRLGSKKLNYIGAYNWRIYFSVFKYYWLNIWKKQHFDVVIEQINNVPFLFPLYGNRNALIFIHQLCRVNWFYQVPRILAWIGYLIFEPIYLLLLNRQKVITVSQSTKKDLIKYGFKKENVFIISEAIDFEPITDLQQNKKYKEFSILSLGNIRNMKKTHHQVKAFEIAKQFIPNLKLYIAGSPSGTYATQVFDMINKSIFNKDIHYLGKISNKQKGKIMQKCHCVLVTSTKEGWGLVVTEAASQGTPAIVYNVDGLRDSVKHKVTGLVCNKNTAQSLAENIVKLYKNKDLYNRLQKNAWEWSKHFNFEKSYQDILNILNKVS